MLAFDYGPDGKRDLIEGIKLGSLLYDVVLSSEYFFSSNEKVEVA